MRANSRNEGASAPIGSEQPVHQQVTRAGNASIYLGDVLRCYEEWGAPTCIIADGPYGLGKFPGEPTSSDGLAEWYAPHIAAWAAKSTPLTTLWFWCSELAWARVHPVLELHGWHYEECCVWDKGIAHIAGNVNSKTIRGFPVVTEVAVRYTRKAVLIGSDGLALPIKAWVRAEWERSGLPLSRANVACGVKNAATRKYLTRDHLWYFPPPDAIVAMATFCTEHGRTTNWPYFSLDGKTPITPQQWEGMRAKWNHVHGLTNVWREPPVHGEERVKEGPDYVHANQKPLALMERQIESCSDEGDLIWEPFGGLCSASVAANRLGRRAVAAEINESYFRIASKRLKQADQLQAFQLRAM